MSAKLAGLETQMNEFQTENKTQLESLLASQTVSIGMIAEQQDLSNKLLRAQQNCESIKLVE